MYEKTLNVEVADGFVMQDISSQYLGITAPRGAKVRLRIRDTTTYESVTASLTPDEARELIAHLNQAITRAETWR